MRGEHEIRQRLDSAAFHTERWRRRAPAGRMKPLTRRWAMSTESVIWSILGMIIAVGGLLGLAAIWSLIRRPREH
ncbi:hypothetical protein ACFFRL_16840 [Agromyces hippuratus]